MANFENTTNAEQERLTRIAASYGTTPERLIAAAARREASECEAFSQMPARKTSALKRIAHGFHIGESTTGWRR